MTGCTFVFVTVSAKGGRDLPAAGLQSGKLGRGANRAAGTGEGWLQGDDSLPQLPSVAFGVSCALAELTGVLPQDADYRAAPLCTGDPDDLVLQLADMPGEKVAKIKVGLYEAVRDGMVANLLLEAIPELHLRLDANRAWTPLKAQQFAKYVNPEYRGRIAFLEEPCKTRDDSRAFARETGIAIARDESLREADFTFEAEEGVKAVVIKPTLTGSLDKVREQVAAAHALGLTAVISSSIESSLGLTQLARIAAWLTPQTIPGLDTLSLMQCQQVRTGRVARCRVSTLMRWNVCYDPAGKVR